MTNTAQNKRGKQNVVLVLVSGLVIIGLLEIAAKIYIEHFASEKHIERYASLEQRALTGYQSAYKLHRYLGFIHSPNYRHGENYHNSLGYRGDEFPQDKPEGEFRIVCIGGSTTYTSKVENPKDAYPAVLEKQLKTHGYSNVRVVNAGGLSYTSYESLINFQLRIIDLAPDLIIIHHGVNDINARVVWPHSAYQADNSGYRTNLLTYDYVHGNQWWVEFNLGRIINYHTRDYESQRALLTDQGMAESSLMFDFRYQIITETYPSGVFSQVKLDEILAANPPIYFKQNLSNLIALAQAEDIGVVLSTMIISNDSTRRSMHQHPAYRNALAEHNVMLKDLAEERHVPVYDFSAEFPADSRHFVDDIHLNVEGAKIKAELFANFLMNDSLLLTQSRSIAKP